MIAHISIEEFRKRLKVNTKLGIPEISGTPLHGFNMLGQKDRKFYGRINQNDFQITLNAIVHPIPYILKGNIKSKNPHQTEVFYQIIPIKFGYYYIRYFPIVVISILCILILTKQIPTSVFVPFSLFAIVISIISNLVSNKKKKTFERKFREIFEITEI